MTAGVTLAASGHIDIPLLQPETAPPPTTTSTPRQAHSPLPAGSVELVVKIGGRVWSAGQHAVHRRPGTLSDISLSPGALYTLEAQGHRLRAVETASGRVAFSHHVEGTVTAAAWSPLPIRIAYLEQVGGSSQLHTMWGTGSHDRRLPGLAAPVAPTWRSDSLAFAYVGADGRVAIVTPTTGIAQTVPRACSIRHAQAITYSPTRGLLAIADNRRLAIIDTTGTGPTRCLTHAAGAPSLAWLGGRQLALAAGSTLQIATVRWAGLTTTTNQLDGTITALAHAPKDTD